MHKQPEHCKGCVFWHKAGHPKDSTALAKYNNWCCKLGKPANKALGECKLRGFRKNASN